MDNVLYCTVLYSTLLYCTVLFCTVLYCIVLYCTVLYCTVLYCTVLYSTVLYCTVLYCIVLYCTVLYCTVPYCTVLYRIVLYSEDITFAGDSSFSETWPDLVTTLSDRGRQKLVQCRGVHCSAVQIEVIWCRHYFTVGRHAICHKLYTDTISE